MSGPRLGRRPALNASSIAKVVFAFAELRKRRVELAWFAEAEKGQHFGVVHIERLPNGFERATGGAWYPSIQQAMIGFELACRNIDRHPDGAPALELVKS